MIDLLADLDAVFYASNGDFTVQAVLRRPGEPDVPFSAQLAATQQEQLDHRFTNVARTLRYPVHVAGGLRDGDRIAIGPDAYRVTGDPEPVADGLEAQAHLTKQP